MSRDNVAHWIEINEMYGLQKSKFEYETRIGTREISGFTVSYIINLANT